MKPTSVLIADSSLLIRRGIRALLEGQENIEVVAEAETVTELLALAQELSPDVVTVDCGQADGFCLQDIGALKAAAPHTQVLAISSQFHKEAVVEALQSGVCSYVLKACGEQEILQALYATARGDRYTCSKILDVLLEASGKPETPCESINLTSRETEIIRLIAEGKSTVEIAGQLFLSPHTINSHRKNILRKLQIKSPAEMIVKALDLGIVKIR